MRNLTLVVLLAAGAANAEDKFADVLSRNLYPIQVEKGRLAGKGADVVEAAIANAQFVMVGEQHAVAEVPQFVDALCDALAPKGFHTIAVEAGPEAAKRLSVWIGDPDGPAKLIESEKKFPDSIAFYNLEDEYALLEHCGFQIWGLDQEFMGSAGLLLSRIADAGAGAAVREEALQLLARNDAALAKARASGNPGELFMLAAADRDFVKLQAAVQASGNAEAARLFGELVESRAIYQLNATDGPASNRRRALLMKRNFMAHYEAEKTPPKVLLKFGDWHLYAGFNPLHNNDIGNMVTELADANGTASVSFAVLGGGGSALRFAGIGKPYVSEKFQLLQDGDYTFMKPLVDAALKGSWTLFDLRGLRKYASRTPLGTDMERLVFGYDFLVLVPEMTASRQLR